MPMLRSAYNNLVKQYGKEKAKNVYYALEQSGKLDQAKKTAAIRARQGKKEYIKA